SQARPGFFGFARPDPSTSLCRNSRSCGATLRQTAEGGRLHGGIARAQSFIAFSGPQAHGYSGQAHEGARSHVSIAPKEDFHSLGWAKSPCMLRTGSRGRPSLRGLNWTGETPVPTEVPTEGAECVLPLS